MGKSNVIWAVLLMILVVSLATVQAKPKVEIAVPVFRGFFQNPDYSKPEVFLQCGKQTDITPEIREIAEHFNDKKDMSTIVEINFWLKGNIYMDRNRGFDKFARTSDQILSSGCVTGCTDWGLIFTSLSRAKGIPAVFIQSASIRWVEKLHKGTTNGATEGHIEVEVLLNDGNWYLVDITNGWIYAGYDRNNPCLPDGLYVYSKSIECYDSGITNESTTISTMRKLFKKFDVNNYTDPGLKYQNLIELYFKDLKK